MPMALLEDALTTAPNRRSEWQGSAFLDGTHQGFAALPPAQQERCWFETGEMKPVEQRRLVLQSVPATKENELEATKDHRDVERNLLDLAGTLHVDLARTPRCNHKQFRIAHAQRRMPDIIAFLSWTEPRMC